MTCLHAQAIDQIQDVRIEVRVTAHGVKDLRARFHQPGQDLGEVLDWKGVVRTIARAGAVSSGARAVPRLPHSVVLTDEQQVFPLGATRYEDGDGVRLRESTQVVKVAVLAVGVS